MLRELRRRARPVALLSYASFLLAMRPMRLAHARDGEGQDPSPSGSTPPPEAAKPKADAPPKIEASVDHVRAQEPGNVDDRRQAAEPGATQGPARTMGQDS